jgi:RNA polymerase sigma-70 factor (ECF subfamily)
MAITPGCEEKSDAELVALALRNQDDFVHIMKRYKDKLARYVLRLTNIDPEDAEDILQDVFLKVYVNLNDFDSGLKFSSWIYRITHNQVISRHRKEKVRPQGNSVPLEDNAVLGLAADLDLAKTTDLGLLRNAIERVLANLDEKYREVLVLRFFEEKSYDEIADIIKRPPGTVATYLNKAKAEFRREMEKQGIRV